MGVWRKKGRDQKRDQKREDSSAGSSRGPKPREHEKGGGSSAANVAREALSLVDGWLKEIEDEHQNLKGNTESKNLSEVKTLLESPFWRG